MRRFLSLFMQDLTVVSRNALMWVVAGALVVIILVVLLLIPADYDLEDTYYFYDASEKGYLEQEARQDGLEDTFILDSLSELEEAVLAEPGSIGIYFTDTGSAPRGYILHYGTISRQNLNLIAAALEEPLRPYYNLESRTGYRVEYLRPVSEPIPQNQNAVPPLLVFEVIVLGFLMAAVLLFQEKADGVNRAYRVTPGGAPAYILAKAAVFSLIGLFYGLLMIMPTVGVGLNYPALILTLILGCFLYTCLGLTVAVFFNNISEWLFIGIALLMVNMTPVISYGWPSFAPVWVTYIPSYPILFGLREILFPTGRDLWPHYLYLAVAAALSYLLCHLVVHFKLMREGR
jgi:hypothetical protein